jgi:hypothetical protein
MVDLIDSDRLEAIRKEDDVDDGELGIGEAEEALLRDGAGGWGGAIRESGEVVVAAAGQLVMYNA